MSENIIRKDQVEIGDFKIVKVHRVHGAQAVAAAMRCVAGQLNATIYLVKDDQIAAHFEPSKKGSTTLRHTDMIKRAEYLKAWVDGFVAGINSSDLKVE